MSDNSHNSLRDTLGQKFVSFEYIPGISVAQVSDLHPDVRLFEFRARERTPR